MDALNCESGTMGGGRRRKCHHSGIYCCSSWEWCPLAYNGERRAHRTAWDGYKKPASPRWSEPRAHALKWGDHVVMRARGDATQFGRHRRGTERATGDDSEEEEQGLRRCILLLRHEGTTDVNIARRKLFRPVHSNHYVGRKI